MALSAATTNALISALASAVAANEVKAILEISQVLSSAEAGYLDGTSPGVIAANKVVVADANGAVGSANLALNSTNEINVTFGGVNGLAIDDAAITGHTAPAATAGKGIYAETPDGGTAAADTVGLAGGLLSLKAGDGSAGGAHTANNPSGGAGGTITISAGAGGAAGAGGSGNAGAPGSVNIGAGLFKTAAPQTIDCANGVVALTLVPGTPAGTLLTSNTLYVDPNGTAAILLLPPEANWSGGQITIVNTAGGAEDLPVKDDGNATVACTISQDEIGIVVNDGTTIRGGIMAKT